MTLAEEIRHAHLWAFRRDIGIALSELYATQVQSDGYIPFFLDRYRRQIMILFIVEYCHEKHLTLSQFFCRAKYWAVEPDVNVECDVEQFRTKNVVPEYVRRYVHELEIEY